jgi:perosamine synthetase
MKEPFAPSDAFGLTTLKAQMRMIPVAGPSITQKEIDYVAEATAGDWYQNAGRFNARFERAFADYVGARHAISLPSCTSAIHLSLAALGIGPGHEVVVSDVTWIASAAPVAYVGAMPVFADIDPLTWCLDPQSFAARITPRTRAVIPIDLYGGMPDMDAIRGIASDHCIAVIEDAAAAIGSQYRGRRAGAFGDTGVFSFHGSKTLTTGEGGMLVTDRDDLYERALVLRDHGRLPGDRVFMNGEVAFKYKMSALQAALGLAQLERIDELVARKRQVFAWYRDEIGGLPGVTLNHEPNDVFNSYNVVTIVLDPPRQSLKERCRHLCSGQMVRGAADQPRERLTQSAVVRVLRRIRLWNPSPRLGDRLLGAYGTGEAHN